MRREKKEKPYKRFKRKWFLALNVHSRINIFILFNYLPMFGIIIAFKQYRYDLGIWASPWNGLKNFEFMFSSPDAWVITRNTIAYNLLFIFGGLVFNVAMAIGLSELRNKAVSKLCQTVVIMPHFLSYVIVSFLVLAFLHVENGLINRSLIPALGLEGVDWYSNPKYWPWILVIVNFWKTTGYGSVVYLAGIAGIDTSLYEAAKVDGASRWQNTIHNIAGTCSSYGSSYNFKCRKDIQF